MIIREIYFISFIFYTYILFSSFAYSFLKYLLNNQNINTKDHSQYLLERLAIISLGLGFCFLFIFCSITNLIGHTFGINLSSQFLWLLPCLLTFYLFKNKLNEFKEIIKKLFLNKDKKLVFHDFSQLSLDQPILTLLKISILLEVLCIFYRLFFPITHGDQIPYYFFDALQISRLNSLTIEDFYNFGGVLRTDSLPSFFDAFNLQMSGSWTISRISKVFSLIISLGIGVEFMTSIKKINPNKIILYIAVITSLIDVWALTVSGKYDIFVFTLEIVAFRVALLLNSIKDLEKKIYLLTVVFFISITAVFSRLSSLALFITLIIFSIYHAFKGLNFYKFRFRVLVISFVSLIIFSFICGSIGIFNFIYLENPFYIISPPNLINGFFPNAIYTDNYSEMTKIFNLRNIPFILKPPLTIIYSALNLEPIRYLSHKFSDFGFLFRKTYDYLSIIGPEKLMIAFDSSSPLILLALSFQNNKDLFRNSSKKILFFMFLWLFFWTLGIAYTRVAIASTTLLIGFSIAHYNTKRNKNETKILFATRKIIFNYSLLWTFLFSIWSFSSIFDLPNIKGLIPYSRSNLTREFLILDNKNHGNALLKAPDELFENNWNKIKVNKYPNILLNAPNQYAYFMNHGLVINEGKIRDKSLIGNYKGNIFKLYEQSKFEELY